MAQNGGAEILYPEQPAAELPDWAAEGMEKFGIPELSGEQTLVGGATGMIGDPSGKSQERNLLDEATLV